jgi:uncharacterized protein YbbC (DUF1343 family)
MQAIRLGIEIVRTLHSMYPNEFQWRQAHFDRLCGTSAVREAITKGTDFKTLEMQWQEDLAAFRKIRQRYLLYR